MHVVVYRQCLHWLLRTGALVCQDTVRSDGDGVPSTSRPLVGQNQQSLLIVITLTQLLTMTHNRRPPPPVYQNNHNLQATKFHSKQKKKKIIKEDLVEICFNLHQYIAHCIAMSTFLPPPLLFSASQKPFNDLIDKATEWKRKVKSLKQREWGFFSFQNNKNKTQIW